LPLRLHYLAHGCGEVEHEIVPSRGRQLELLGCSDHTSRSSTILMAGGVRLGHRSMLRCSASGWCGRCGSRTRRRSPAGTSRLARQAVDQTRRTCSVASDQPPLTWPRSIAGEVPALSFVDGAFFVILQPRPAKSSDRTRDEDRLAHTGRGLIVTTRSTTGVLEHASSAGADSSRGVTTRIRQRDIDAK